MEMERTIERPDEDKDVLAKRANDALKSKGFGALIKDYVYTRGELKETIKIMSEQKTFSGRDMIVLHFNRYQDMKGMQQFADHVATHKFPNRIAAKAFIEATVREAWERVPEPSKKWHSKDRLALNEFIIITAAGPYSLEQIMEQTVPKNYRLPPPYDQYAMSIMAYHWGSHPQINSRSRDKPLTHEEHDKYAPPRAQKGTATGSADKPNKSNTPKRTPKERPQKTPKSGDGVSIATICAALKIDPKEARGALRKANYPKPGASWEWDKKDEAKVSKDIKDAVLKARKK